MTQSIDIRSVSAAETLPIRQAGLRPGEPIETVIVPNDAAGLHLGAFMGSELVSVASLFMNDGKAQFRKFATIPAYQGRGIGAQLLARMIGEARKTGASEFWCNARVDALTIYQRAGLQPVGEPYTKEGRLYQRMILPL
ncbi:MAG: GNAT family N-acetyltransferase [Rhabdaerophilum sp.]